MMELLPILLLVVLLTTFAMEALQLWFYTKRNRLQMTLLGVIILWFVIFLGLEIGLIRAFYGAQSPSAGVLNFHTIVLGLIGFFSFSCYLAVVLHPRILRLRSVLLLLSPIMLMLAVYAVWHLLTDTPINYRYLSIGELWENRWSMPVVMRVLLMLMFIIYLLASIIHFQKLITLYNKYSEDNYSDVAYNVLWLRMIIWVIASITVVYMTISVWKHPISALIYVIVVGIAMFMLTDNAVFHRLFTHSNDLIPHWSFKKGWQLTTPEPVKPDAEEDYKKVMERLDGWMDEQKPFLNPDFCAKDLYAVFPELTGRLSALLEQREHTFQSYVREYRIKEACRLMTIAPELSNKELAFKLGFTIASSFNRAFVAVMKITPQNYKKQQQNKP